MSRNHFMDFGKQLLISLLLAVGEGDSQKCMFLKSTLRHLGFLALLQVLGP